MARQPIRRRAYEISERAAQIEARFTGSRRQIENEIETKLDLIRGN